jgi:outer membrane protein assembly factor BamB
VYKNILGIGIILLFIVSLITPMTLGYNIRISNEKDIQSTISSNGPMNSAWPMYCHDVRHTGRSPYSTTNNIGFEKWRLSLHGLVWGAPVIDDNGIIYIGAWNFYAIYPNGTIKWQMDISAFESAAAIDENDVLYVGSIWAMPNYLYAIYTSNGTLKWKYFVGDWIASSPAIGDDGSIYFGSENDYIYALYPNGTLKWKYLTGIAVWSDPAIGDDGTIYCGSYDGNLYALYPNNGTLKWKYQTGDWVARGPSVADDGTIYFGSWDGYLYAVYPDGSLKWKTGGHLAGTTPVTAQDGTIYVGNRYLTAIYPSNGSVKWTFDSGSGSSIRGSNPCISADGTIYFGTFDSGEIIAVNSNGAEKWRRYIGGDIVSAPAIGKDGTVYIGDGTDDGCLHAFGSPDPNAPNTPSITGITNGKIRTSYDYTFTAIDPNGDDVFYYISWGDGTSDGWLGPYDSSEEVKVNHTWNKKGTYVIQAQARDINDLKSDWGKLTVKMPKDKVFNFNYLLLKLVERFPLLEKLFYFITKLLHFF